MSGSENTSAVKLRAYPDAERDLWDLREAVAADLDALSERIELQADFVGQIGASFHALAARVAALEGQGNPTRGAADASPRDSGSAQASGSSVVAPASPAPPAPLVERMEAAYFAAMDGLTGALPSGDGMRAALLVAAEELLRPVTDEERRALDYGWEDARVNAILHARLARAKEAAK